MLQVGGTGLFGLSLPKVLAAEESQLVDNARAKSVMFLYLFGGPSQLETFDMKPDAATNVRGPFKPIAARTSGLRICEHLPRLAERSDKYCVVRTLNHPHNDHNASHYIQTGHPMPPAERGPSNVNAAANDWPAMGSMVEYLDRQSVGSAKRGVLSNDHGKTWDWDNRFILFRWAMHQTMHSPCSLELADGRILTLFLYHYDAQWGKKDAGGPSRTLGITSAVTWSPKTSHK
jgi:hypothetical protein